jgi:hypothetical protein
LKCLGELQSLHVPFYHDTNTGINRLPGTDPPPKKPVKRVGHARARMTEKPFFA